jgi:hypothetical protein
MKHMTRSRQILIITVVFIATRIIAMVAGLRMDDWALSAYWQYLDLETLKTIC